MSSPAENCWLYLDCFFFLLPSFPPSLSSFLFSPISFWSLTAFPPTHHHCPSPSHHHLLSEFIAFGSPLFSPFLRAAPCSLFSEWLLYWCISLLKTLQWHTWSGSLSYFTSSFAFLFLDHSMPVSLASYFSNMTDTLIPVAFVLAVALYSDFSDTC